MVHKNGVIETPNYKTWCSLRATTTHHSLSFAYQNPIPYFRNYKFVRVSSLVGRHFYTMYLIKSLKLCFPLTSRTLIYFHVYIIIDFPITYKNTSVLCQSK